MARLGRRWAGSGDHDVIAADRQVTRSGSLPGSRSLEAAHERIRPISTDSVVAPDRRYYEGNFGLRRFYGGGKSCAGYPRLKHRFLDGRTSSVATYAKGRWACVSSSSFRLAFSSVLCLPGRQDFLPAEVAQPFEGRRERTSRKLLDGRRRADGREGTEALRGDS